MNDLLFPVVGTALVFVVAVPLATVAVAIGLGAWGRRAEPLRRPASPLVYALLLAPVLVPVLWLASAAAHQNEGGGTAAACAVQHLGAETCRDVAWFGACLLAVLIAAALPRTLGAHGARTRTRPLPSTDPRVGRVQRLRGRLPQGLGARVPVRVVGGASAPMATRGLLRPRVEIDAGLVDRLDDAELAAALLHEREHARGLDPLRLLLARTTLAINPTRALLAPHLARWCFAREVACDRAAVAVGADPLALARSIVAAASPKPPPAAAAALGGAGLAGVRLRVFLLLDPEAPPAPSPGRSRAVVAGALAPGLLVALPHLVGTGPLDVLHAHAETLLRVLLLSA